MYYILWTIFSIISLNKHLRADLSRSKYDYNILKQMCCLTSCTVNSLKPHLLTSPSSPPPTKKKSIGKPNIFWCFQRYRNGAMARNGVWLHLTAEFVKGYHNELYLKCCRGTRSASVIVITLYILQIWIYVSWKD